ncbi:DUF6711 family protein [Lacrimispora sp.]|jgi:hypothetical protein|uniref:DUF6711 family protein n=1 Tax=Lacrimispora sp. TaxID=2719234 RepID=UPI0028976405|nr:DUF6711 family protein [Lacrimispora sp.]
MSYQGYLLKVDGVIFPNSLIAFGSFSITPNQRQDQDSYRDSTGYLHRNILPHKVTKIEFNTKLLHESDKAELENILRGRDEYNLEYWNSGYQTGTFYSPDLKFDVYDIDKVSKDIRYKPVRIAMIEY